MAEKAFKFRLYPNEEQKTQIVKNFGCCRKVYNLFLELEKSEYELNKRFLSYTECSRLLTELKKIEEYGYLKKADATSLQRSLRDLEAAFKNFFAKRTGFPNYKKKSYAESYTAVNNTNGIEVFDKSIKLPKLGRVKCKVNRPLQGRILSATISRTASGKYYVSVLCTGVDITPLAKTKQNVGIDLGIHSFCTLSTGDKIAGPKAYIKEEKKLKRAQRKLSRMKKGSANYGKQRIKKAKIDERIANIRNDWQHKLSLSLVKSFDVICVEDLAIKKMLHKNRFAKYQSDAAWGSFLTKLEYKAQWYGKTVIKVDRYFASSQTCCVCGCIEPAVKSLKITEWTCPKCGANHDRDINAAINLLLEGRLVHS